MGTPCNHTCTLVSEGLTVSAFLLQDSLVPQDLSPAIVSPLHGGVCSCPSDHSMLTAQVDFYYLFASPQSFLPPLPALIHPSSLLLGLWDG